MKYVFMDSNGFTHPIVSWRISDTPQGTSAACIYGQYHELGTNKLGDFLLNEETADAIGIDYGTGYQSCTMADIDHQYTRQTCGNFDFDANIHLEYSHQKVPQDIWCQFLLDKSTHSKTFRKHGFYQVRKIELSGEYYYLWVSNNEALVKLTFHQHYSKTNVWKFNIRDENGYFLPISFLRIHDLFRNTSVNVQKGKDIVRTLTLPKLNVSSFITILALTSVKNIVPYNEGIVLSSPVATNSITPKRTTIMLEIKNVTLINGKDATTYSVDQLVDLIKNEEKNVERLGEVKTESKAIAKLKEKHQANIKALTELLDNRE